MNTKSITVCYKNIANSAKTYFDYYLAVPRLSFSQSPRKNALTRYLTLIFLFCPESHDESMPLSLFEHSKSLEKTTF